MCTHNFFLLKNHTTVHKPGDSLFFREKKLLCNILMLCEQMCSFYIVCDQDGSTQDGYIEYSIYLIILGVLFLIKIASFIGDHQSFQTKAFICAILYIVITLCPKE